MREARIAEWILSLVTSLERSASTVGDLIEEKAGRGAFWFWSNVGRTALSALWSSVQVGWPKMVGVAGLGLLIECLALVAIILVPAFVVGTLAGLLFTVSGSTGIVGFSSWVMTTIELLAGGFALVAFGFVDYRVGRWLARRLPGQEIAACLALIALEMVPTFVFGESWTDHLNVTGILIQIPLLITRLPLFAGAALVRRQRIAS